MKWKIGKRKLVVGQRIKRCPNKITWYSVTITINMQQVYERFEDNTRTLLPNPPGEWGALTPSLPACWTAWPTKRTYHTLCVSVYTWGKTWGGFLHPLCAFRFSDCHRLIYIKFDYYCSPFVPLLQPETHAWIDSLITWLQIIAWWYSNIYY